MQPNALALKKVMSIKDTVVEVFQRPEDRHSPREINKLEKPLE